MGAFDGVRIPGDRGYPTSDFKITHQFFPNFSFSFFDGFGEPELRTLLAKAEKAGSDTVWVPTENKGGTIGLRTWYVRALLNEHFGMNLRD